MEPRLSRTMPPCVLSLSRRRRERERYDRYDTRDSTLARERAALLDVSSPLAPVFALRRRPVRRNRGG